MPTRRREQHAEPPRTDAAISSLISRISSLISRVTRLEIVIAVFVAATMVVLVAVEPDILEAPFENSRTVGFTFGGTLLAAIALAGMLRYSVPPLVRIAVLVLPFVLVNWWLISPYFRDEVVDEAFATSIDAQTQLDSSPVTSAPGPEASAPVSASPAPDATASTVADDALEPPATTSTPAGPVLLGAGRFVGLAGHSGTGDAGIFRDVDGSHVLRFENFDIENGPDLAVYLVPGADQTSLPDGSIPLGELKGNIGDQNYVLPPGTELVPGAYTALVWCEAFAVEFVGATVVI